MHCLFPSLRHSSERLLFASAAGHRNETTGALTNVGTYGYAWASSPWAYDLHAGILALTASMAHPLTGGHRVAARAVRCVQASAPKLLSGIEEDRGIRTSGRGGKSRISALSL